MVYPQFRAMSNGCISVQPSAVQVLERFPEAGGGGGGGEGRTKSERSERSGSAFLFP